MSSDPKQPGRAPSTQADDAFERELAQMMRRGDEPAPPLSGLFGELEAQLAREHGPRAWLSSRPTPMRLAMAFAVLLAPAAVTAAASLRPDIAQYPLGRMIAIGAFLVASLTTATLVALRPLHRPALPSWMALTTVGVAAFGLLALYALPVAGAGQVASPHAPDLTAALIGARGCLLIGLAVGAAVLALLLALDRGGLRRALVLSASAGLCANLVLQFHCPNTARAHVLLGHFGVLVLLLLGAVVAGRIARTRSPRD